jgi:hypothetical protein
MRPNQLLRELHQANKRLQVRIDASEREYLRLLAQFVTVYAPTDQETTDMSMSLQQRLRNIKEIQEAAAAQRKAEAERPREPLTDRIAHRLTHLRLRELAGWFMSGAEIRRLRKLEREAEKDRDDYRNHGDWTK